MEDVFVPHWQKLWANWKGRHWSIRSIPDMHASDWKDEGPSVNLLGEDGASSVNPLGDDGASSVDLLGEEGPSVNPLGEDGASSVNRSGEDGASHSSSQWKGYPSPSSSQQKDEADIMHEDGADIMHELVTQTLALGEYV